MTMIKIIRFSFLLFVLVGFFSFRTTLPKDVKYFPDILGSFADSVFFQQTIPYFFSINLDRDAGMHKHIYLTTMSNFKPSNLPVPMGFEKKESLSQALIFKVDQTGVFPKWQKIISPDSIGKSAAVLRYHPDLGVYSLLTPMARTNDTLYDFLVMDSTFHLLAESRGLISNVHDYQLSKTAAGQWQLFSSRWTYVPLPAFYGIDNFYLSSWVNLVSDKDTINGKQTQLWGVGPTMATFDSSEWSSGNCQECEVPAPAPPPGFEPRKEFHDNSYCAFQWSHDSILVCVSERNINKIHFWWVVDSANVWVTRGIFCLGAYNDKWNNFTFVNDPHFQIKRGHNFRALSRSGDTLIASYFDNEACDTVIPARGLILSLDLKRMKCRVLDKISQNSFSATKGNIQIMLKPGQKRITEKAVMQANRCIYWGTGGTRYPDHLRGLSGYFPSGDIGNGLWEVSVLNPHNQTIVGITVTDWGYYTQKVYSNMLYQVEAWYDLPVPTVPIQSKHVGANITLSTALVNPVWITGETGASITVTPSTWGTESMRTYWVRGKTDKTMIGEIWEKIVIHNPAMEKK